MFSRTSAYTTGKARLASYRHHPASHKFIFVLLIMVVSFAAKCDEETPDHFMFTNDLTAPNVIPDGGNYSLKLGVLSVAQGSHKKDISISVNYTQYDLKIKGCTSSSMFTNEAADKCEKKCEYHTSIQTEVLAPGGKWISPAIPINNEKLSNCACTVGKCFGAATATLYNNNGKIMVQQRMSWQKTQTGNPEELKVFPQKAATPKPS